MASSPGTPSSSTFQGRIWLGLLGLGRIHALIAGSYPAFLPQPVPAGAGI